jgi:hypothetical protein
MLVALGKSVLAGLLTAGVSWGVAGMARCAYRTDAWYARRSGTCEVRGLDEGAEILIMTVDTVVVGS